MVDNTIALGIRPPAPVEFNPLQALLIASQLRNANTNNSLAQMQLSERGDQTNALKEYRAAVASGDKNALSRLAGFPELQANVVKSQSAQMNLQQEQTGFRDIQLGKAAGEVLAAPAAEQMGVYQQKLEELRKANILDQEAYERAKSTPPNPQMLTALRNRGLTIEQQITLGQKDQDRQMGRDIIQKLGPALTGQPSAQPGTPNDARLVNSESGGDPTTVNNLGYAGRYQFGAPRLATLGVYSPGENENIRDKSAPGQWSGKKWTGEFKIPGHEDVKTIRDFLQKPEAQVAAYSMHKGKMDEEISAYSLDQYFGKTVGGVPITPDGMRNMLHLGGVGSAKKFLESDGKIDPKDGNGTPVSRYARMGATPGQPAPGAVAMPTSADPNAERMVQMLPQLRLLRMSPGIPEAVSKGIDETIKHFEKGVEPTGDIKEYGLYTAQEKSAGRAPRSFLEWQKEMKEAGASRVSVTQSGEKKGTEALYNKAAEDFQTLQSAAREAQKRAPVYSALEEAMKGFTTGATAEMRLKGLALMRDAGLIKGDNVPEGEVFRSAQRRLELLAVPKGQGQITENERGLIRETVTTLGNSPEANIRVLGMMRKLDAYDTKVAQIYRDVARKHGGVVDPIEVADEVAKLSAPLTEADTNFLHASKAGAPPAGGAQPGSATPAPPPGFQLVQ